MTKNSRFRSNFGKQHGKVIELEEVTFSAMQNLKTLC